MKKVFLLSVLLIFLVSCSFSDTISEIPLDKFCNVDQDCIPSVCCHADDAVNKNYAPDCAGILCSQECRADTLDCQQGEIRCLNDQCRAVIFNDQ